MPERESGRSKTDSIGYCWFCRWDADHFEGDDHLLVVTNTTTLYCITAVQVRLRSRTNKEEWQRMDITFIHPLAPGKRVEHSFPVPTSALSVGLYSEFPAVDFEFTEVWAIPKNEP